MTLNPHSLPRSALALALCLPLGLAHAQSGDDEADLSGKLLLTGGVSQVEGSAGGGLTPWAVIGGNAYFTRVDVDDYSLYSYGVLVGLYDRVELSFSRQEFDTQAIGGALG